MPLIGDYSYSEVPLSGHFSDSNINFPGKLPSIGTSLARSFSNTQFLMFSLQQNKVASHFILDWCPILLGVSIK